MCGGPAEIARVLDGATVGAWCGPGCVEGCRAGLTGVARRAVVAGVAGDGVVLTNARGRLPLGHGSGDSTEELTLPLDFPCTRFTGIVVDADDAPRPGQLLHRWPLDRPWTCDVAFDHWLSHQPQGTCEDGAACDARASLWVCYGPEVDRRSCGRCLSRRLRRLAALRPPHGELWVPDPVPVAAWDPRLQAWHTRPYDGAAGA